MYANLRTLRLKEAPMYLAGIIQNSQIEVIQLLDNEKINKTEF
jgi:hypothetical protein